MKEKEILGIDIGGSGIKGMPVNIKTGEPLDERLRIPTPLPATPDAVADVIKQIAKHFKWKGKIGCGFPAVVQNGLVYTASNIDKSWININANKLFSKKTGLEVTVTNDADVAGLAEMKFGSGQKEKGTVLFVTIGTGLGTAIFRRGKLLPNTEFGHILLHGGSAERYASDAARKRDGLKWNEWAERFNEYLQRLEFFMYPDLILLGGGASKKSDKYLEYLTTRAEVKPAKLLNHAGIIGAAYAAK